MRGRGWSTLLVMFVGVALAAAAQDLPEVQKTVRQWKETHPQETGMGCARCRT